MLLKSESDSNPKEDKMSLQMILCSELLDDLFAKKHQAYAKPFYKHPMDLLTVKVLFNIFVLNFFQNIWFAGKNG